MGLRVHQKMSGTSLCGPSQLFKIIPGVVDGIFLPRHPQELLASADFQPVPSIIGVNSDEYGWIIPLVRPSPKLPGAGGPPGCRAQGVVALGPSYPQLEIPLLPRS